MLRLLICGTLIFFAFAGLSGQVSFHISGGTQVVVNGHPSIVLQNASWNNDGLFTADSSRVIFRGDQTDSISGSSETQFYQLFLDKGNDSLRLAQSMQVDDSLFFQTGTIALEGKDLTLGTDHGVLIGESESSRVTGANGGEVVKVAILNTPSGENPGNIGMTITSAANPGPTVIRRGHQPVNLPGGESIDRYYDITPAINSGLNAVISFAYFNAELNGLTEANLESWHQSGSNWINREPDSTNGNANTVAITLDSLGRSTLAEGALKLQPVVFLQGAFSGTQMSADLRSTGSFPTTEPYTGLGYPQQGGGGESIDPGILTVSGNDAIVDWIFLELRDAVDSSLVRTQSALLQADGDVVGLDGASPVTFAGLAQADYFVSVKHRNHLGVRTAAPLTLSRVVSSYDFSSGLGQVWNSVNIINAPMEDLLGNGSVFGLFTGDVNGDQFINATDFQGTSNLVTPNQFGVYEVGDLNLDGNLNATDFQTSNNVSTPNKIGHIHP